MKFRLLQRQKQKMKMKTRLVVAGTVFAFFAVTTALTFIFNIGDIRSMFAQTNGVDRYWVGNTIYNSPFDNQWEVDAWSLNNDNGTGSFVLSGSGTATLTVDNAGGGYANQIKHTYDGAPVLFPLDTVNGRLDLNVTATTGGRTVFSVDAEQYDANGNYLATIQVMQPAAYCGYFVSQFYEYNFHNSARKVRFVINAANTSSSQGSVSFNLFSYYNGNNDWKNPANWASATGGAGGETAPGPNDNAIFDGTYTGNCNINGNLNVGGILIGSGYSGTITQNSNTITVGSSGFSMANGTFNGGSGAITVNGPTSITGASATFKSTSADLTLNGDFTLSAGTFTHNSGRVVVSDNMTWTGTASLYDMSVSAPSSTKTITIASGTTVTVNNTLTLAGSGTLFLNGAGTIAAKSGITLSNTGMNGGGSATILVNGTGAQALTGNSTAGQGRLPKLTIDKASGTATITNTLSIGGDFTYVKGGVTLTGSTLAFGGSDLTIDAQGTSTLSLNNVIVTHNVSQLGGNFTVGGTTTVNSGAELKFTGYDVNISGATTVNGTLSTTSATGAKTLNDIIVNTGGTWNCSAVDEEFNVNGSIENYGTFTASNGTTTNTMYYLLGNNKNLKGNLSLPRIEVDNGANNASYTNFDTLNVSTSLRGNGGTLIQNTNSYLRIGALPNASDFSLTTLNATAAGNTVNYNLNTNQGQEVFGTTYHHIISSGSGSKTLRGAITVNGNVTIKDAAILDPSASNYLITVKGDWRNSSLPGSSLAPFNARNGTVTFTGTVPQTITCSAYTGGNAFYNLTFNNTSTTIPQIIIGNNDGATNTLNLTSGHIDATGATFTLGTSAANRGTLNFTAGLFIGGTFKRWASTAATTIGSVNGLLPLGYKENATTVSNRSAYFGGTPTNGGTISARHNHVNGNYDFSAPFDDNGVIVDVRHNMNWVMTSGDGLAGSSMQLRLTAGNIPGVNDPSMLRIVLATGVAPGTSTAGGGSTAVPIANKSSMPASGYNNTFHVGSAWNTNPLPITLLSFTAKPENDERVKLDWVTASEENNDYFTVERSKDGIVFEEVLRKEGAGNSNTTKYYTDYDNSPLGGLSYYRLKQTDFNGEFSYSNIVPVQFDGAVNVVEQDVDFNLYPNPASAMMGDNIQFAIDTEGLEEGAIVVNLIDMGGRIVMSKQLRSNGATIVESLGSASELKAGMYTVVMVIGKKQVSKKLIIQ